MKFQYSIEDCDIKDAASLQSFRVCLVRWHEWLREDEEHSIFTQINRMMWNDSVFWMINEARRLSDAEKSGSIGFNGPVLNFIDQSYTANQLLAIRRLTERDERGDTISLRRLIDDMEKNAVLFTRENYVCNDGLPFDPAPAMRRSFERAAHATSGVSFGYEPTSGPEAWGTSQRAHSAFDKLTAADAKDRNRDDQIDASMFHTLKSKLGACDRFSKGASKFIAHAADAGSRARISDSERRITFIQLANCQKLICRVASYIHGPLLFIGSYGLIPTPQYNQFENLDKSWIKSADMRMLYAWWDKHSAKIEGWVDGDWADKFLARR